MKNLVERQTSYFHYGSSHIKVYYWYKKNDDTPDTVLFLGTGQVGKIAQWTAQAAPAGTIVVEGVPHWKAHPSAKDLKEFMEGYTVAAFDAVIQQFNTTAMNVIGESQAAPCVLWLALCRSDQIRNIALIAPLGFNISAFGDNPSERLKELKRRAMKTLRDPTLSFLKDGRNLYVTLGLLRARLSEKQWGASDRKYATGLSYDSRADLKKVVKDQQDKENTVTLYLGENDLVFPPNEIIPSLREAHIEDVHIQIAKNAVHSSLALRHNQDLLSKVIHEVRQPGIWS